MMGGVLKRVKSLACTRWACWGCVSARSDLGGTFDIQGVPGDGTIVTVSIPLKPNE